MSQPLSLQQRIRDWRARTPLTKQISAAVTLVALITALLTATVITASEYSMSRRALYDDLHTQAKMIAANAEAAVLFEDPVAAAEILAALRASPDIREGRLIRADGSLLASFRGKSGRLSHPITVREPVLHDGAPLAQFELTADFSRHQRKLLLYAGLIFTVLMASVLALRLLFTRVLRVLSEPLQQLMDVMKRVSAHGDYSLRSGITGINEVGELAHSFDTMLGEIERRDAELDTELAERKRAEEQLAYIAHYDTLTGLPNRHAFNTRLKTAGNQALPIAVLLLDVDQFKVINDTLGHYAGDALLQGIAGRLHAAIVNAAVAADIYRIGGDEFAVVVGGSHPGVDAEVLANRFIEAMSAPQVLYGQAVFSTASIGLACYPDHAEDIHTLIRHADVALYAAKGRGRKRMCVFDSSMNARAADRLMLEADLRKALLDDALYLVYEPQIDVRTHRLLAAEALVRWNHPVRGNVTPGEFIPVAEETGLIIPLGEWVLKRACTEGRAALEQGLCHPDFKVGVNLSPRQLADPKLVESVARILRDTGFPPRNLEFEVTESSVVENIEVVAERMHAMRSLGITFAMDDFGVGATSLSYLKKLPLSKVKIDRSFVQNLPHDEDDATIATAIIAMAHRLKKPVLAEGIERPDQLAFLRAHACDMAQGYMIGRGAALHEMLSRPELAPPTMFDMPNSIV